MQATIEDAIARVEQLYATITGHPPPEPNGSGARIPPETDPGRHVEEHLARLIAVAEEIAPGRALASAAAAFSPRVSAWRDDAGLHLAIEVPGVGRESIELQLAGTTLVVRGHRAPPWGEARVIEANEAPWGAFARAFELGARVEPGQLSSRLEAGVLHVHVARAPHGEPSHVTIQV